MDEHQFIEIMNFLQRLLTLLEKLQTKIDYMYTKSL